jgi:hypothetical protein
MAHECLGYEDSIAEATAIERERIIKLLEDEYSELIETYGIALVQKQLDLLLKLVALIKGENK